MTTTTTAASTTTDGVRRRRPRARRATWRALRTLTSAHVLLLWAQASLAGGYLGGDYDFLALHALNADLVTYSSYVMLLLAGALWPLRGPRWVVGAVVVLVLAETGQYVAGLAGTLAIHVPLGVAIVAGSAFLAVSLWRPCPVRMGTES